MKKFAIVVMIGMVAGIAAAQDMALADKMSDVEVSADLGLYSAYVWRGQVLNENMVAQPAITAASGPFSLNVWGNWNLLNSNDDDTEVDFTAAYTLPDSVFTDAVSVDVGMICYTFPGSGNGAQPTEEIFASATFNDIILTPVATAYYDIDEVKGWYGTLGVSQCFCMSDALSSEVGASVGYGSRRYNQYYFGNNNPGGAFNDYNVYVSTSYALSEDLTLGALLQYTMLDGGVDNSGNYEADDLVWGGINLSYSF